MRKDFICQHSSTADNTGLFSGLLDYITNKKGICIVSSIGDNTNVLFRYNGRFHYIVGDAYG